MTLTIKTLGGLTLFQNGQQLDLPRSKKTRALLAYLAMADKSFRRDHLCELFWKEPNDPRSTLRWSLSKIRPLVNQTNKERLVTNRDRVSLLTDDVFIDIQEIELKINDPFTTIQELESIGDSLAETFLDGTELPDQERYQRWLMIKRHDAVLLHARVLMRLSTHPELNATQRLKWARRRLEVEPFNPAAGTRVMTLLESLGMKEEMENLATDFAARLRSAGIAWSHKKRDEDSIDGTIRGHSNVEVEAHENQNLKQKIGFCTTQDNVRIAYASAGTGAPIVKVASWPNHIDYDWDAPVWSPLFHDLATDHRFIRYDQRGSGLSEWDVEDLSFDASVNDLKTVVDTNQLNQFTLLGIAQGAAVAIAYAVKHPQKVSHLVLFGGYAVSAGLNANENTKREKQALITLAETGWSRDNPAYRQIFSSVYIPNANTTETAWYSEFQRSTTSPENAARLLSNFDQIDVRDLLQKVTVPTLVIHSREDQQVAIGNGLQLAAQIPNAEFLSLDTSNHSLLGREPAAKVFLEAVRRFIDETP
ncbi:guanylate cyclase [Saccharospirillum sp. MSK14-1]|uniref:alpha/beta hydrolase n=1 Tax=Saccharospirillum sp. MSK14-1 TaxID=1897632 RepID=UPI000D336AA7|nr:alpha/beta hydrolase [Saccharospirillum sp. MSK14-1]PTY38261.1 guanylate cyclase [Saccharospirillum sp. MSK14-1]